MKELEKLINDYQDITLSDDQIRQLNQTVYNAKSKPSFFKKMIPSLVTTFAIVLLPNISPTIASGLHKIPVIKDVVEVICIRDYYYDDGKNEAVVDYEEIEFVNDQTSSNTINKQIKQVAKSYVDQFEKDIKQGNNESLKIKSKVIVANDKYFTLELSCYENSASAYTSKYYYTIDTNTKQIVHLDDLYKGDYLQAINKELLSQMKQAQKDNPDNDYFIEGEDAFKGITHQQAFYINTLGQLVIHFDQGDVAPAYLGEQNFTVGYNVMKAYMK